MSKNVFTLSLYLNDNQPDRRFQIQSHLLLEVCSHYSLSLTSKIAKEVGCQSYFHSFVYELSYSQKSLSSFLYPQFLITSDQAYQQLGDFSCKSLGHQLKAHLILKNLLAHVIEMSQLGLIYRSSSISALACFSAILLVYAAGQVSKQSGENRKQRSKQRLMSKAVQLELGIRERLTKDL